MTDRRIVELLISVVVIIAASLWIYWTHTPMEEKYIPAPPKEAVSAAPKEVPVEMLQVPVDPYRPVIVGIIGESRGDETIGEAFNAPVLEHLLQVLKQHQVQAIFSTGNLVNGRDNQKKPDSWILEQQLQDFTQLYESVMGKVPFFPTMGNYELAASKDSELFRQAFHLGTGHAFSERNFGYTVSMGNALFVVVPTNTYEKQSERVVQEFEPAMLAWLDKTLKEGSASHKYLFVVGHDPAFLTSVTFADKQTPQRDAFWKILVQNGVLAYFSEHNYQFDRTQRQGVWQVISGGSGSPLSEKPAAQFYHTLLLTIPPDGNKAPTAEVYDDKGKLRERFELSTGKGLLHQLHITKK